MIQSARLVPWEPSAFEVPDIGVVELILGGLKISDAHRLAIDDGINSISFGELKNRVRDIGTVLTSIGLSRGKRVALHCPNSTEFAVLFLGILQSGAACVPVGISLTPAEMTRLFSAVPVDAVITKSADRADMKSVFSGLSSGAPRMMSVDEMRFMVRSLGSATALPTPFRTRGEDIAMIALSSGTTGYPKGVVLKHRNLVANILQMNQVLGRVVNESTKLATPLPYYHIFGANVQLCHSLFARANQFTCARFSLLNFLQRIETEQISLAFVTPSIIAKLANESCVDDFDLSALKRLISGAAPLSPHLARRVHQRLGCAISQGYGMTETSPVTHINVDDTVADDNVGRPVPGTEVRIVRQPRASQGCSGVHADNVPPNVNPAGLVGEIWVKGPQVMDGYLENYESNDTLFSNGWFCTGDLGAIDPSGNLRIAGRMKCIIKYKGYQISPIELEEALRSLAPVNDAVVVGVPRATDLEEVPTAFVSLAPGSTATSEEIKQEVNLQLARYKRISAVHILPEIPHTPAGKPDRKKLIRWLQV